MCNTFSGDSTVNCACRRSFAVGDLLSCLLGMHAAWGDPPDMAAGHTAILYSSPCSAAVRYKCRSMQVHACYAVLLYVATTGQVPCNIPFCIHPTSILNIGRIGVTTTEALCTVCTPRACAALRCAALLLPAMSTVETYTK